MATLSLTTISEPYDVFGKRRITLGRYTGPTAYPNGADDGDPFTPAEVGLGVIDLIVFENPVDNANPAVMRAVTYDVATERVLWYDDTFAQLGNGTDLSTFNCRFMAIGR